MIDDAEDGEVTRGGSTITQQVAKNLFLWPGRSVVRKALELPLALWIDLVLPKQRMLEIYLNIAELGPSGQFGAEAGVQLRLRPFGRDAVAARGGAAGGDPAQSGQAQRPQSRPRRAAAGRDLHGPGAVPRRLQRCWSENRGFLSRFWPVFTAPTLALRHPILYKRGLIGISARAFAAPGGPYLDDASDNTPRGHVMAVPRRKTSPSRRGMRRSADALKKPTYAEDKDSGELRRPHHLDLKTGMYKGRQVLKAKKES